jgi:hypothetical protein
MALYVDCAFLNSIMDVAQTVPPDPVSGEAVAEFTHDWQMMIG